VKWIDRGTLRDLSYGDMYAMRVMGRTDPLYNSLSYRLSAEGTTTSIEEMIKSTERGILVTRFNAVQTVDSPSGLVTGFTRDGLWLIEHGKISKPIKNFRFTESPLFMLNNVESFGEAKRVFSPPRSRVAPALKVRDFSFTSLADAV
jgi:predicted Zn-dependent protease